MFVLSLTREGTSLKEICSFGDTCERDKNPIEFKNSLKHSEEVLAWGMMVLWS